VTETGWYAGTADAVFQNIDIIEGYAPRYMVILAGDHVYKMDYEIMLQEHVDRGADVTVGCMQVPREQASGFGVMDIDAEDRILSFVEKPADPPGMPGNPTHSLASMGIYVFDTKYLIEILKQDANDANSSHDFGKDIVPALVRNGGAVAHRFEKSCVRTTPNSQIYWRDVGTVDAYWEANIDLTDFIPGIDLYDTNWPIWTYGEITPPAKFVHDEDGRRGSAISSLVSGGCIVSGAQVGQSLLFTGVHAHSYTKIFRAVILPYVQINRHARLSNVVVDRGVIIPPGLVVGEDPELDARRFRRSDRGICLITQPMIDRLGM
jgi:glucose-1-phosphate adenylyltransferase